MTVRWPPVHDPGQARKRYGTGPLLIPLWRNDSVPGSRPQSAARDLHPDARGGVSDGAGRHSVAGGWYRAAGHRPYRNELFRRPRRRCVAHRATGRADRPIRNFAVVVALLSSSTLAYKLAERPLQWVPLRFVDGSCAASVYVYLNGSDIQVITLNSFIFSAAGATHWGSPSGGPDA